MDTEVLLIEEKESWESDVETEEIKGEEEPFWEKDELINDELLSSFEEEMRKIDEDEDCHSILEGEEEINDDLLAEHPEKEGEEEWKCTVYDYRHTSSAKSITVKGVTEELPSRKEWKELLKVSGKAKSETQEQVRQRIRRLDRKRSKMWKRMEKGRRTE